MAKKGKLTIDILLRDYDKARSDAKEAKDRADDINAQIKDALGDTEEVDTPTYICTYKYDKDKTIEQFDEETFAKKEPKAYNTWINYKVKYTKAKTTPGARKLIVVRKNEGEE
jgi:hypothetical protein